MTILKHRKRKSIRIQPDEKYPIRVNITSEDFIDILDAADISESGIGIETPKQLEICQEGASISLSIPISTTEERLHINGIIKHISSQRIGIQFADLDKKDRKNLKEYLSFRLKRKSPLYRLQYFSARILYRWFNILY